MTESFNMYRDDPDASVDYVIWYLIDSLRTGKKYVIPEAKNVYQQYIFGVFKHVMKWAKTRSDFISLFEEYIYFENCTTIDDETLNDYIWIMNAC